MNRRSLITSAAITTALPIAGCTNTDTNANSDQGEVESRLTFSVSEVDADLDALSFSIEVTESVLSETEYPMVEITVTNTSDGPVRWVERGSHHAFPATNISQAELWIGTPEDIEVQLLDEEGCMRVRAIWRDDIPVTTELEAGESMTDTYGIVGSSDVGVGECPDTGVYRAEWEYDDQGIWGFDIELNEE